MFHTTMANDPNWRGSVLEPMQVGLKRLFPAYGAPVIPVVRLSGTIGRVSRFQSGMTLAAVAPLLRKAFSLKPAPAVALVVNSPGGSPVQSHFIYKRIRALAEEKEKTVIVFVEDVCASGVVEAMRKVGVERRVYTSGDAKVILDPFQPEKEEDVARLKAIQEEVHDHFIEIVRTRRGEVLAKDRDDDIFSGQFWSGKTAVSLGLADRAGDIRSVLRERYGEHVRLKLFSTERSFLGAKRGVGFGGAIGSAVAERLLADLDERALWERYRL
jgi:ClpP class serine protease